MKAACLLMERWGADGFDQLLFNRVKRIEAGQRVLKDHRDPATAQVINRGDILAIELDPAFCDTARTVQQTDHRSADGRFSRTGFSH